MYKTTAHASTHEGQGPGAHTSNLCLQGSAWHAEGLKAPQLCRSGAVTLTFELPRGSRYSISMELRSETVYDMAFGAEFHIGTLAGTSRVALIEGWRSQEPYLVKSFQLKGPAM